jgi:hypothetical protein
MRVWLDANIRFARDVQYNEKRVNEPSAAYPSATYDDVFSRVQHLALVDQFRLLEDVAALARRRAVSQTRRSILEIEGLGQEIWQDMDAQQYIDQERAAWNG